MSYSITPRGSGGVERTRSAVLIAAQDAPTLATEGVDCSGCTKCAVAVNTFDTITNWSGELWVYDGHEWAQAVDADGMVLAWDAITTTYAQIFDISGFVRCFFRIDTITGTSLRVSHAVTGP